MSVFKEEVYKTIGGVPTGKVISYSQVAATCGKPGAARRVGQIAHFGPSELPWHRLVKADGTMASGFVPGGPNRQKQLLMDENVSFIKGKVDMKKCQILKK